MKRVASVLAIVVGLGAFGGCKAQKLQGEVGVYMPDGAPALAFAKLMKEDTDEDGVSYFVVNPSVVATKVSSDDESKNADFCVLPVTASSKLIGSGDKYKLLATVTNGNLFLISKDSSVCYTTENLHLLKGKTVGVLQMKNVPGLTLKSILKKAEIPYQELANGVEKRTDAVNLRPLESVGAIGSVDADCFLIAEPAVSAQSGKGFHVVGDLQSLYGADEQGEFGYPQAVLVAKSSFLGGNADWIKAFLARVKESAEWVLTASGEEIVSAVSAHLEDKSYTSSLKASLLTPTAIAGCGVRYATASESKERVQAYLLRLQAVEVQSVALVGDSFFWSE